MERDSRFHFHAKTFEKVACAEQVTSKSSSETFSFHIWLESVSLPQPIIRSNSKSLKVVCYFHTQTKIWPNLVSSEEF